jgi:hypothetical protein
MVSFFLASGFLHEQVFIIDFVYRIDRCVFVIALGLRRLGTSG